MDSATTTTFVHACAQWLDGVQVTNETLWGHPIWWWARVGKIAQFVAACAIIVELIGAERINRFAESIGALGGPGSYTRNLMRETVSLASLVFSGIVVLVCGGLLTSPAIRATTLGAICVFALVFVVSDLVKPFVTWIFLRGFVNPLLRLLRSPRMDHRAKSASFVMFLGGFFFDLLAS